MEREKVMLWLRYFGRRMNVLFEKFLFHFIVLYSYIILYCIILI